MRILGSPGHRPPPPHPASAALRGGGCGSRCKKELESGPQPVGQAVVLEIGREMPSGPWVTPPPLADPVLTHWLVYRLVFTKPMF